MRNRLIVGAVVAAAASSVVMASPALAVTSAFPTANWAGYFAAQSGKQFASVSGTFKIPSISCPTDGTIAEAGWFAGLGGFESATEAAVGVASTCTTPPVKGTVNPTTSGAQYTLFAMFYGKNVTGVAVKSGTTITAKVSVAGKKYTLSVKDSAGPKHTWTFSCATTCDHSTAEWFTAKGPGGSQQYYPLALVPFTAFTWKNLSAKTVGASSGHPATFFKPTALDMVDPNSSTTEAFVDPLRNNSFVTHWQAAGGSGADK